jgi:aryl-alcohol dehydrogenase-like predicted oxidoreductase
LETVATDKPLPRRRYNHEVDLSVIGMGGIVLMGMQPSEAANAVAEAVDRGVNYFDVAPLYGDGEAEQKLGPALAPHRKGVFLACKTMARDATGANAELTRSLKRLQTDHFDLYQCHAVMTLDDVEQIFAPGGAMVTIVKARDAGMIRYVGFSAHSEEAALAMMARYKFDSVLFPVNLVCYARSNFGPAVIEEARKNGVARLALKVLARSPWPEGAQRTYTKAWYRPIDDPEEARKAVRFTLSEDVTATIPPGDLGLFRLAMNLASEFHPLSPEERTALLEEARHITPLFPL